MALLCLIDKSLATLVFIGVTADCRMKFTVFILTNILLLNAPHTF